MATVAAIYTRISSDPDGTGFGVARQETDCRKLAAERGWEVGKVYQDNDLSAYKSTVVRPAFQAMLKAAEAGDVQAIVVYDADRMTRQPIEWERIIGLVDRKGTALATCSGDLDLSTDQGQFMARIMGATARKSSDDTRRRIKRKKIELAEAGKFGGGGQRAYGYASNRVTVVEAEAEVIREIVRRVISGDTLTGIAADLDRRGVRTVSGKPWRPTTIRRLIQSARIAGRRESNGVDIAKAVWPAIIDIKDVERVRSILFERPKGERTVRSYALAGLLFCGRCGAPMRSTGKRYGKRRYGCVKDQGTTGHCARTFIQAEGIEAFIREDAISKLIQATDFGTKGRGVKDAAAVEARLAKNQRKLGQLVRDYAASDDIPEADFEAARADLKAQNVKDRAALAVQSPQHLALSDLIPSVKGGGHWAASAKAWALLEPARQSAILKLIYQRIEIGPGRPGRAAKGRFQSERVTTVYAG